MDLLRALPLWETLGNTIQSGDDEQGNYVINFIDKKNEVVGWVKVYPGQGIRWSYPDELMATNRLIKERV
jgi:hypothetical protein